MQASASGADALASFDRLERAHSVRWPRAFHPHLCRPARIDMLRFNQLANKFTTQWAVK